MGTKPADRARRRLSADAKKWAKQKEQHEENEATRNENIRRSVKEEGLSLQTVGEAYGVTRQYIGQIVS